MSNPSDHTTLQRGFVTVDGAFGCRQVHYRRGGQGPVVLLLHQSPQSSREMEPLIAAWGHAFTLIAPDSPGYGCSQPLQHGGQPAVTASMDDLAAATLEFADALGLGRFGIYGFHTGASIGTALAAARPDRVTAVAANGLVVLTEAERATILRDYLPPLVPRWDGGHLAWLWARLREQTIFFPWHDRRATTRMDFDVPPADRLQAGANEFLAAGVHYAVAYAAAFADRAERRLPGLRVPLLVTAAARDPLAGHLARIGARSASVQVVPSADGADALDRAFAHLASHPGEPAPDPARNTDRHVPAVASDYLGAPGRQVRVIRTTGHGPTAAGRVILVPPPGSSAAALGALAADLARHVEVLAVDLPGHGASDPPPFSAAAGGTLAGTVAQLGDALGAAAGTGRTTVVTVGAAAPVGIELARRLGPAADVVSLEPPAWSAADVDDWLQSGLPALAAVWSGGHLLEAWHMVRDGRLFSPWFRRERAGIRPGEPDLDDERIQREVTDLLRANGTWQPLLRDTLTCPHRPERTGGSRVTELPTPPQDWATVLGRQPGSPHPKLTL